ncbi:Transferrin, partial [Popillia japonica]
ILCTTDKYRTECQKLDEKSDIECIVAEDEITCIEHVSRGKATFSSVTAAAAFLGMAKPNIVMHAAFQHKKESNPYKYQTALVSNRNIKGGLSGLRNVSYCHPGFDATDIDPLRLIEFERELLIKNDIDIYSNDAAPIVENHIKAIHDFFGPSCRPGRWVPDTEFDETLKKRYSRLLVLCNTTNSGNALSQALNCALNNDNPAIALTTIFTITHEVQKEMSAFTICRNGSMSNAYLNPCEWSNLSNEIIVGNNNSGSFK